MPKQPAKQKLVSVKFLAYSLLAITILFLSAFNLYGLTTHDHSAVLGEQTSLSEEKEFWIKIIEESPTYTPALLELGKIEVELGNLEEAENYASKVEELDPNSKELEDLKTKINN